MRETFLAGISLLALARATGSSRVTAG
jgi:hypothetical protein